MDVEEVEPYQKEHNPLDGLDEWHPTRLIISETYIGVIKKPYFKFIENSEMNGVQGLAGIIITSPTVLFRGETQNRDVSTWFSKLEDNITILVNYATKKEYKFTNDNTGQTTKRQVRRFSLEVGDEAVYKFLKINDKELYHKKTAYKKIEAHIQELKKQA